jgi:hypothetical protein
MDAFCVSREMIHCDLIPVKVDAWLRLAVGQAHERHLLVSFNGEPGYLADGADKNDCCLFNSSFDGRQRLVPIQTICILATPSEVFLKDVRQLLEQCR